MPQVFIDLITTGNSVTGDRIIKLTLLKVDSTEIFLEKLINPEKSINQYILRLNNFNRSTIENSPTFLEIANEIKDFIGDSKIYVSNKLIFGILKNEFKRVGVILKNKYEVINVSGASSQERLRNLYQKSQTLQNQPNRSPPHLNIDQIENLPNSPGVYIFYDQDNTVLYVGKSIDIKKRVKSHFNAVLRNSKELHMFQQVSSIEFFESSGELTALLHEYSLIKKLKPIYNRKAREILDYYVIKKSIKDGYITLTIQLQKDILIDEIDQVVTVCSSKKDAVQFLNYLSDTYQLCKKLLNIEKTKRSCFNYRIEKCSGACIGDEIPDEYNNRLEQALEHHKITPWPYENEIKIKEQFGSQQDEYIINKWCIEDNESFKFDYYLYQVLKTYLLGTSNKINSSKNTIITRV